MFQEIRITLCWIQLFEWLTTLASENDWEVPNENLEKSLVQHHSKSPKSSPSVSSQMLKKYNAFKTKIRWWLIINGFQNANYSRNWTCGTNLFSSVNLVYGFQLNLKSTTSLFDFLINYTSMKSVYVLLVSVE